MDQKHEWIHRSEGNIGLWVKNDWGEEPESGLVGTVLHSYLSLMSLCAT